MELNVKDRLLLLVTLPKEGDIVTMKIVRDLRNQLSFNESEITDWKLAQTGSGFTWDDSLKPEDTVKEISISVKGYEIVQESLKKLSAAGKLTEDFIDLFDKFSGEVQKLAVVK